MKKITITDEYCQHVNMVFLSDIKKVEYDGF